MSKFVANRENSGFNRLRDPKDGYARRLWEKHGLGVQTSFKMMEPVVQNLLKNSSTALEGAEIMLGRRIDSTESQIGDILIAPPENRFGLLLIAAAIEEMDDEETRTTSIIVTRRSDDFHACVENESEFWACGKTPNAAIGNLIRTHPEIFRVRVRLP